MRPVTTESAWFSTDDCDLEQFREVVERSTHLSDHPFADRVEQGVLVYGDEFRAAAAGDRRRDLQAELVRALSDGPGVVVVEGAVPDTAVDRVTAVFDTLIAEEQSSGQQAGDHFAATGANDRLWGALDKLALRDPQAFADYYSSDAVALVAEAWLGPAYQVTSQVNVVRPGGSAQVAHRDYHLGFLSQQQALGYPARVHVLTPALTLQGAVAHCDMPVESGPTLLLPHSQKFGPGYLAFHEPRFTDYFDAHRVQLPLAKGDAVFFSPALFHAAGSNTSADVRRTANLLQVSSPFGRAMEAVDRVAMCRALFPVLLRERAAGRSERSLRNVVAAAAEGYAFPTNLDRDPPRGGLAPESQADVVWRALQQGWTPDALAEELDARADRSQAGPAAGVGRTAL